MTDQTTAISPRLQTITELFTANLPRLEQGMTVGKQMLAELQASQITNDSQREAFVEKMVKIRRVYEKIQSLRMQVTKPLDELKDHLMSFERDLDDTKKDNAFAQAKQIITAYDQAKLEANRAKEKEAERQKQITLYKADVQAAVGRACIEMLAGQQRNLIEGVSKWESQLTLENIEEAEKQLNTPKEASLSLEKYNACFSIAFSKPLLSEEETKVFIESLKFVHPYDLYNKKYLQIRAEIHNALRAKMPTIKASLIEAKANKELEAKRQADIAAEREKQMKASEDAANVAVQEVVNQKDLSAVEASFVAQAQTQDLETGPTKKVASFTNDALWIRPFLAVVQEVAGKGITITNAKGYIPSIQWWLTKFELASKPIDGITLKEVSKTILKEKKLEE